jgi:hypothetical protein
MRPDASTDVPFAQSTPFLAVSSQSAGMRMGPASDSFRPSGGSGHPPPHSPILIDRIQNHIQHDQAAPSPECDSLFMREVIAELQGHIGEQDQATEVLQQNSEPSTPPERKAKRKQPYEAYCVHLPCDYVTNLPDHYRRIHRNADLLDLSHEVRTRLNSRFYQCPCGELRLKKARDSCGCPADPYI